MQKGSQHSSAKLDEARVIEIKRALARGEETQTAIARGLAWVSVRVPQGAQT